MTSTRQVEANRANARKSTGPKTAAGKAITAGNATRHAILQSNLVATKHEDAGELALYTHRLCVVEAAPYVCRDYLVRVEE